MKAWSLRSKLCPANITEMSPLLLRRSRCRLELAHAHHLRLTDDYPKPYILCWE
jgi:hypothetical protein